jgi:hypothetical protein
MIKFAAFLLVGLMITLAVQAAPAVSTLSWEAPTTRVDGTPFSMEDIQEYRVTYTIDGEVAGDRPPVVIDFAAVNAEIVVELTPREMPYVVAFQIVVVDTEGRVSRPSDPVSKEFAVDSTASPQPPTNIQFRITCGDSCEIEEIVRGQ